MRSLFQNGCVALLLWLVGARALAQDSSNVALSDAVTRARIVRVQAILDERAGRAKFWQYGWMGLGYAVTGGFVAIAATSDDSDQRLDFAFAAGGALIDTSVHALGSINVHAAARLREQPETSPEQLRAKLLIAEAELTAAAEAERDRRSLLKAQILPVGFSITTGLVLGLGFGHLRGAVINTVAAIVINELRVLTQPTSSIAALEQYQRDPDAPFAHYGAHDRITWSWVASPLSYTISGSF